MKLFLLFIIAICSIQSFALTPSERLNLVGSSDIILTGKVLASTITYSLRAEEPVNNISVKVIDQYKGGVRSLFDITVPENETALKTGAKYLFFMKYSLGSNRITPLQKNNWSFIEGTDYLLLVDLIKRYPISIEITNAETTMIYTKKNFIKCKISKTADSKVDISNIKLNIIVTTEEKDTANATPSLMSLEKVNITKLTDRSTNLDLPVKLRNTDDKHDYQVVVQPIFYLKINGIPCEYSGAITIYNISDNEL